MKELSTQTTGGTLTSSDFNEIPKELENIITSAGLSLSGSDFLQVVKALAAYAAGGDFYTDSGAADAYVLAPVGSKKAPPALFTGMRARFIPANTNTGASTINVDGLGAIAIKKSDGSTALAAGDIAAGRVCELFYDGSVFRASRFLLPTKGDLLASAGGGLLSPLGVGVNGKILMADSSKTLGVNWGPDTYTPQIPIRSVNQTSGTPASLEVGGGYGTGIVPVNGTGLFDIYFQVSTDAAASIGMVGGGTNQNACWMGVSQIYNSDTITPQRGNIGSGSSGPLFAVALAAGTLDGHIRLTVNTESSLMKAHFEIFVVNQATGQSIRMSAYVNSSYLYPYSAVTLQVPGGTLTGKMTIIKIV